MAAKNTLIKVIQGIIRENWEERYRKGSNEEDFMFDKESKSLYDSEGSKKKIRNYLKSMGLIGGNKR